MFLCCNLSPEFKTSCQCDRWCGVLPLSFQLPWFLRTPMASYTSTCSSHPQACLWPQEHARPENRGGQKCLEVVALRKSRKWTINRNWRISHPLELGKLRTSLAAVKMDWASVFHRGKQLTCLCLASFLSSLTFQSPTNSSTNYF